MLAAIAASQSVHPPRRRLTRGDCAVLEMNGQLDRARFELVEGDLIEKMPKNWAHTLAGIILQAWLAQVFGPLFVGWEAPIDGAPEDIPTSEPEPDLLVFNRPATEFKTPKRTSADLWLVVEVSNTTLRYDSTLKAGLYARAGILEYWILDINGRKLGVHRDPKGGEYRSVTWFGENESVAPLAAPDARFAIRSAFGS